MDVSFCYRSLVKFYALAIFSNLPLSYFFYIQLLLPIPPLPRRGRGRGRGQRNHPQDVPDGNAGGNDYDVRRIYLIRL